MPPEVRLLGVRHCLPGAPITSADIAPTFDVDPATLERETGVRARHRAEVGQGPSDLALEPARELLAEDGLEPTDLDLIVFATTTPDVAFPGAACFLQHKLGAATVGALDVRAQNAGFIGAVEIAASLCEQGGGEQYRRILIGAGEVMSSGLDHSPAGAALTPLFGDGAAAALVGPGDRGPRIGASDWKVDGSLVEKFWCEFPASRNYPNRVRLEDLAAGRHLPRADLAALAGPVEERLAATVETVLQREGWAPADLSALIVDYAQPSVARAAAGRVGIASDRVRVPTEGFGQNFTGGLPIELARGEAPASGSRVVLAAAGPGLAWGAIALQY